MRSAFGENHRISNHAYHVYLSVSFASSQPSVFTSEHSNTFIGYNKKEVLLQLKLVVIFIDTVNVVNQLKSNYTFFASNIHVLLVCWGGNYVSQ